ncbi:MAG: oxidoreductase [Desulfobacterales bacterium]|nr:oxidoreductase [Desulfobacterales bacterium]
MREKPKIALYWCSSCGGCEESVIDLAQGLLDVARAVDIVFWPVAIDTRYSQVADLKDGELAATFINGAIRLDEHVRMARLLRQKSKLIVAHGACAHLGGVIGLANFNTSADLLNRAYREVPTVDNPSSDLPGDFNQPAAEEPELASLQDRVSALGQVIQVDYTIPGCPPPPEIVTRAMAQLLQGELPPPGSVLAEKKALCHSCPRLHNKPEIIRVKRFHRLFEKIWDPDVCFLEQGVICAGPVTRGGCKAQCVEANMPCRGCFGPVDGVADQGARFISLLAAIIDSSDEKELMQIADSIPDQAGLFYRYSAAVAILQDRCEGNPDA